MPFCQEGFNSCSAEFERLMQLGEKCVESVNGSFEVINPLKRSELVKEHGDIEQDIRALCTVFGANDSQ